MLHRLARLLALALLAPLASPAASQIIDAFDHSDNAPKIWRAVDKTPPVVAPGARSIQFPCPFDRGDDRFYWDRDIELDLSRHTSLRIELSCDNPAALRAFGIYLRSGSGWYVWAKPLREAGRQTLILHKADFDTEGAPSGWNRINRIRLSPWKGTAAHVNLTLFSITANRDTRVILKPTLSAPNATEKAYGGRVADRVSSLLTDAGISHTIVNEEEAPTALAGATLAILPCNQQPPASVIAALKKMIASGGKAMVFFGGSDALADAMGVRLGDFQSGDDLTRWNSYAFTEPQRWRVPAEIFQRSMSTRLAFPANERGRVIATWRNASGQSRNEPAWLSTDRGLWMTHILLDDDLANKKRMLTGLAGSLDSTVWAEAARDALITSGKVDSYSDFNHAAAALETTSDEVRAQITAARAHHQRMLSLYQSADYRAALDAAASVDSLMVDAYALAQKPRPNEIRGVWEHDGTGWYPGDWNKTCEILARSGINTVYANLLWGGNAHFANTIIPTSKTMKQYGDQAALFTKAAQKYGIQSHLWVVCCNLGNTPPDFLKKLQAEGRTQVSADGKPTSWLNLAHPKNQQMLLAAITEAVRAHPFDGVHLDYIRYPGSEYDYSTTTRQMFEASAGKIANWPQDVRPGGKHRATFAKWRAAQITAFVRRAHTTIKAINPDLKISAAVWGGWPDTIASIGQDWATWIKDGTVDYVTPMNYTASEYQFHTWTSKQLALPGAAGKIIPGIGVTADESQLRPDQVIEQIATLRRLGAPGFVLFDLSHTLKRETLPALTRGSTRQP